MDKDKVKKAQASGDKLLGAMVLWRELNSVRIQRSLFRAGIEQCGLGDALAAMPKAEAVLNRAVLAANASAAATDPDTRAKVGYAKLKSKTDAEVTYAVLMHRDVGGRMTYLEESTITIDRGVDAPAPVVMLTFAAGPDANRDALVARVLDQYTEQLLYSNTEEVSQTLVRSIRDVCSGLTLRSGLYLVRPESIWPLDTLAKFLAGACGAELEIWEQRATDRNVRNARGDAKKSLREQFDELLADVNEFSARHTDVEDVAIKSVNARVRKFKELDAKVDLYADIVGDYAVQLREAIAAARTQLEVFYLDGGSQSVA